MMVSRALRAFGLFFVLTLLILIWGYNFGPMYGGKKYQLQSFNAEAKVLLKHYYETQAEYYRAQGHFDVNLHRSEDYVKMRSFKFGFNSDFPELRKYCDNCVMKESSYKLGAIGI
jgi:hypothetical protein